MLSEAIARVGMAVDVDALQGDPALRGGRRGLGAQGRDVG